MWPFVEIQLSRKAKHHHTVIINGNSTENGRLWITSSCLYFDRVPCVRSGWWNRTGSSQFKWKGPTRVRTCFSPQLPKFRFPRFGRPERENWANLFDPAWIGPILARTSSKNSCVPFKSWLIGPAGSDKWTGDVRFVYTYYVHTPSDAYVYRVWLGLLVFCYKRGKIVEFDCLLPAVIVRLFKDRNRSLIRCCSKWYIFLFNTMASFCVALLLCDPYNTKLLFMICIQ